jgi:pimeloyl-ACP methyl ester carboxylesterase
MGNDIDVFQKDELENDFWRLYGPKDESFSDLFKRGFSTMMKMLMQPKRFEYQSHDLESKDFSNYIPSEYGMLCNDIMLHCARWDKYGINSSVVVIYLHTNTRSLVDAKEILPFCDQISASLLSFDLRGCGKSAGNLGFNMVLDLAHIVNTIANESNIEIILWSRGMSTAIAVEYLSTLSSAHSPVKFLVLDSPFISTEQMVQDAAAAIKAFGVFTVPSMFVSMATNRLRKSVEKQLGSDPFTIQPITYIPKITTPCYVLIASRDDYIPESHGLAIFNKIPIDVPHWKYVFVGLHFGVRDSNVVCQPANITVNYVRTSDSNNMTAKISLCNSALEEKGIVKEENKTYVDVAEANDNADLKKSVCIFEPTSAPEYSLEHDIDDSHTINHTENSSSNLNLRANNLELPLSSPLIRVRSANSLNLHGNL